MLDEIRLVNLLDRRCAALRKNRNLGGLKMHLYNCRHACLLSQDYVSGQMQQCRISLLRVASRCESLSLAWSRSFMSNIHTHVYVIILLSMWSVFLTR